MTLLVPAGIDFAWPSTAATVPSGYQRDTGLDGYHVKGAAAGADPGTTGGSATHTHTSPGHTHTVSSHTHAFPVFVDTQSGGTLVSLDTSPTTTLTISSPGHAHASAGTTSGSNTASLASLAATWSAGSSEPSYVEVIWIQSLGTATGVPANAWCWWDNSASGVPSSWTLHATPKTRYLKGAAAGGNGGSTGGGGSHSHAASQHRHSFSNHTHSGGTTGAASGYANGHTGATLMANDAHTHAYAVTSTSASTSSYTTSASSGSTTSDPPYTTLATIANGTGGFSFPEGIIGVWRGLLTNIPAGWILCDGTGGTVDTRNKFVKGASVLGDIAATGGASTHDHTDPTTHTHTTAHTHPATIGASAPSVSGGTPGSYVDGAITGYHTHPSVTLTASSASTSGTGTQTVDLGSSEPLYKTVLFIKFTGAITVTVTTPTDGGTVTTPAATITWTIADSSTSVQANYRIRVYETNDATSTPIYDSDVVTSASLSTTLPTNIGLRTGRTYYVRVTATDTAGDPGDSALSAFVTNWTPPATITGLTVTPVGGS